MNILFFLTPKEEVAYIYENETLRQTLEKMEHRRYSCIPILSMDGKYIGSISEGDLLWEIKKRGPLSLHAMEAVSYTHLSVVTFSSAFLPCFGRGSLHILGSLGQSDGGGKHSCRQYYG